MKTFEEFQEEYMKNAGQIDEHREIWRAAAWFYKKQMRDYEELRCELYEYMGLDDAYLKTIPGLKKLNKDELIEIIIRQRAMYRKLFNELDSKHQKELINDLEKMEMKKAPL